MMRKLWPYLRPYKKWFILGILCSAAEAVFELQVSAAPTPTPAPTPSPTPVPTATPAPASQSEG